MISDQRHSIINAFISHALKYELEVPAGIAGGDSFASDPTLRNI